MSKILFALEKQIKNVEVKNKHQQRKQMKTMTGHSSNLCTGLCDNITPDYDE